jgi:hypothetical protein
MQTAILQVSPEEFLSISTANMVADENLIPKPPGMLSIKKVELKYPTDTAYKKATKARNDEIDALVEQDLDAYSTYYRYAPFGRWIKYWPTPGSNSSAGMRLTWSPSLTMGADTDVPDLHLNLHEGIIYRAQEIALGDTDEITDPNVLAATQKLLSVVVSRIPLYYQQSGGEPDEFEVDIDKEAGW